jgi:AcrR family transcriptional regulator
MNLKGKIITEAARLFSEKGFLNTSITEILDAAGTSKGGLYNHFRNKEELCLAVLAESRRVWREINLAGVRETASPLGRIYRILENYRDRYLPDSARVPGGCIFIRVSVESSDLARQWPKLAAEVATGFTRFKAMLRRNLDQARTEGEIAAEISTEEAADMIFSAMMGASVIYSMGRSRTELDRSINSIIHYIDSKRVGKKEVAV